MVGLKPISFMSVRLSPCFSLSLTELVTVKFYIGDIRKYFEIFHLFKIGQKYRAFYIKPKYTTKLIRIKYLFAMEVLLITLR